MHATYTAQGSTAPHHHQPAGPWEFLADKLPAMDLTAAALAGAIIPAVDLPQPAANGTVLSGPSVSAGEVRGNGDGAALPEPYASLARCLYRRTQGHVLLTGDDGVGKTTVVRELARLAAEGEVPFLTGRRFLWLDCSNIGAEDSRACLETILAVAGELPEAVLCLDGLAALLRRPSGGTNIPLLRAAAARPPGRESAMPPLVP